MTVSPATQPDAPPAPMHEALLRPGVLAALGLALGQIITRAAGITEGYLGFAAALLCLAALLALKARGWTVALIIGLLFMSLGAAREGQLRGVEARALRALATFGDGGESYIHVEGALSESPTRTATGWTLMLAPGTHLASRGIDATIDAPMALFVNSIASARPLIAGDSLTVIGTLRELPADERSTDPDAWLRARGAVARVSAKSIASITLRPPGITEWILSQGQITADAIEGRTLNILPSESAAVLVALTIGRTHLLTPDQMRAYRRTGLLHLFSVSGLHTMLLGASVLVMLRTFGAGRLTSLIAIVAFLLFFAAIVGPKNAVIRAMLLLILYESQPFLRRPVEPLSALATIAAGMMLAWPRALWQLDFQLTYLCMLAIVWMMPWTLEIQKRIGRRLGWGMATNAATAAVQTVVVSIAIQLLLAPVFLANFGQVSIVSPLANVAVLPLVGFVIPIALLAFVVSTGIPALGAIILSALNVPLKAVSIVTEWLSAWDFATFEGSPFPLWLAGIFYAVLLCAAWSRYRKLDQSPRSAFLFAMPSVAVAGLLILSQRIPESSRALTIVFMDVGQGDAIALRAPDGSTMLVDAGPPVGSTLLPDRLRQLGIRHLDLAVATHADADHIGGLATVLDNVPVRQLAVGGSVSGSEEFADVVRSVQTHRIPVVQLGRGAAISLGGTVRLRALHPSPEFLKDGAARNDASVVLDVEFAGRSILLTGDAELLAEQSMLSAGQIEDCDVLKAGHHGSGGSSSPAFLEAAKPEVLLFSCGRGNRYGHPSPLVEKRLSTPVTVFRTDHQGSITLRIDLDGTMTWKTER